MSDGKMIVGHTCLEAAIGSENFQRILTLYNWPSDPKYKPNWTIFESPEKMDLNRIVRFYMEQNSKVLAIFAPWD